jgi:hypothetical protein
MTREDQKGLVRKRKGLKSTTEDEKRLLYIGRTLTRNKYMRKIEIF